MAHRQKIQEPARIPGDVTIWIGDCAQSIIDTANEADLPIAQVLRAITDEVKALAGVSC